MKFQIHGILTITEVLEDIRNPLTVSQRIEAIARGDACEVARKNMVINNGLDVIRALIGGFQGSPTVGGSPYSSSDYADMCVHKMKLASYVGTPPAPAATDTALSGVEEWEGTVDAVTLTVSYTATAGAPSVIFSTIIPQAELIGVTLKEEGLFTNDDTLFARTTFSKEKLGTFALQFDHELTVARA